MKVFLVEDSVLLRERLGDMIDCIDGMELVAEADSEEGALRGIEECSPDVMILDLNLNGGSGMEVLRRVKSEHPEIAVAVLTNHAEPQYRNRCFELGADFFFDKSRDIGRFGSFLACFDLMRNELTTRSQA